MSFARRLLMFAAAYWAGAELSYALLTKAGNFSVFWPPAGIYLGMLLATPRSRWWGVALAAAVPNLLSDVAVHQQSFARGLGFLAVNVGAPLVAAALLERLCRPAPSFVQFSCVVQWLLVVTFVSTPLGALGGAVITVKGYGGVFLQKWFLWWVGDLLGTLALTPLAYRLCNKQEWPRRTRILEAAALLLSLSAATWLIFRLPHTHALPSAVLYFFLLWAALRFGPAMVAAATTTLAVIALWLTGAGFGPYLFQQTPEARALMVQVLAATGAVLFYILAAAIAERRAAERELQQSNVRLNEQVRTRTAELAETNHQLRESEARLQLALASAGAGIHVWDIAAGTLHWDNRLRELWGIGPDAPVSFEVFLNGLHPDDRAATQSAVDHAITPPSDGKFAAEYRVISQHDSVTRWIAATGQVFFENGKAVRLIGTARDITAGKQTEAALRQHTQELEEFNELMVGRELRMIELKQEINLLCQQTGQPPRYEVDGERKAAAI